MDHYLNITIKPDAEMRKNVLLNKVYSKLHKALFLLNSLEIGISFPKYNVMLGDIIRLHSSQDKLTELQKMNWLGSLAGYFEMGNVLQAPQNVKHRIISRKQSNMTAAKLRRLIKRGTITAEQAKGYHAKMFTQGMDNPYLELESSSNGHKHRRYIQFGELLDKPISGEFDAFGLSKTATVPWF